MMKVKFTFFFIVILFEAFIVNAQEASSVDSLHKIINTEKNDTIIVNAMLELSDTYSSEPQRFLKLVEKSLAISKKTDFKAGIIKSYLALGLYYTGQSEYDKSIQYFDSAVVIARNIGDERHVVAALGNAGNSYCYKSNYNKGLEYYLKALEVMNRLGDKSWIATANNNIGNIYYYLEDDEQALKYYLQALKIYEEIKFEPGIALATGNIGNIYNETGKSEKALKYFFKSLEINEKLQDKFKMTEAYSNIAITYSTLKENEKAIIYYLKARQLSKELGDKNGYSVVGAAIGKHYIDTKEFYKAEKYIVESIKIGKEIGVKQTLMACYQFKAQIDSAKGNYLLAYEDYKKYAEVKDSLFQETKSEQIAEMQTKFDTKEKEKENELLKAREIQNKALLREKEAKNKILNIIIYAAIGAFVFVLAIAFLLLRIGKQRKKANKLLEYKNSEILQQKEEIFVQSESLSKANTALAEINKDLTDSINYARRIQEAMLPKRESFDKLFNEYFIFFKPRDIVSGDFYWIKQFEDYVLVVVADCTGHGVPGAFLSMLGMSLLNEIAAKREINSTEMILEEMRSKIVSSLKQDINSNNQRDGMDITVIAVDKKNNKIQFSGANHTLYLARKGEIALYKGVSSPIGVSVRQKKFERIDIDYIKGDVLYMFSDGYPDQFHHKTKRKLKTVPFRNILTEISQRPLDEQHNVLENYFDNWKGDFRQIDDVLVMGIKL